MTKRLNSYTQQEFDLNRVNIKYGAHYSPRKMLNFPNKPTVATDIEDQVRVHEAIVRAMQEVKDDTENNNEKDGNFFPFIYITLMA